jgi:phosphoglycerate dehydrogenase-like enzyme
MAIFVLTSPLPSAPFIAELERIAPDIPVWSEEDRPAPEDVEAILAWRMKAGVLPRYPNLRVLCSIGAGVDKLITTPDLPPKLPITRVVDPGQSFEIAQYVVGCALHFIRDLSLYVTQQSRAQWERHPVRPVSQCRVGVLGLGGVGLAIARAFGPLGYAVAGWSRQQREVDGVQTFAGAQALPGFLAQTDILVCALPLTDDTRGLLDRSTLSRLPRGAIVINVGRGEHLVEADLRVLLDEGHLAGAALDVFEREPLPPDNWIWTHPKLMATPHIASQASAAIAAQQCIDALRRARLGLPQPLAVDRRAGY